MVYDLIIVGGGPAGLSAAVYAGRSILNTLIIEKKFFGGRLKDTAEIVNYPSVISSSGIALVEDFRKHASSYTTNNFIYGTVVEICKDEHEDVFEVKTLRKGTFKAKSVILALGTESRVLGIEGEERFQGQGVSYCATCDANFFSGKDVHILGSGDVALEEADYISKFANHVTVIVLHDDGIVDGNETQKRIVFDNPKISFMWNSSLDKIIGEDCVNQIVVKNLKTGEKKTVLSDGVFLFVGLKPQTDIVNGLCEMNSDGFIIVDEKKETSVSGLFAAGDCTHTYLRQVVSAVSDGAVAAVAAERYIRRKEKI